MRIGIISDIHSNADALSTVENYFGERDRTLRPDRWLFLGDVVGYCSQPIEAIRILDRMLVKNGVKVLGNHDAWMAEINSMPDFVSKAQSVLVHQYIKHRNTPEFINWFSNWNVKKKPHVIKRRYQSFDCWYSHGVYTGADWPDMVVNYLYPLRGDRNFHIIEKAFCFLRSHKKENRPAVMVVGHSHMPAAVGWAKNAPTWEILPIEYHNLMRENQLQTHPIDIQDYDLLILSPGSVGIPRNPGPLPHAAMAVLDTTQAQFEFYRIQYDPEKLRKEMAGDPSIYCIDILHQLEGALEGNPLWGRDPQWRQWREEFKWTGYGWEPNIKEQYD